jgi:hypothetical protein
MYKIERKTSGYLLTFKGLIEKDEMQRWCSESRRALSTESAPQFGVIVDMRDLKPLPEDAQHEMVVGQQLYKEKGMNRSAVVLNNTVTTLQFKRLAKESGIYQWERYIDASKSPNWVDTAVAWVRDGRDPDA